MARLVYRRFSTHEALVAVHSVATAAGSGGIRWYELRVRDGRALELLQQGTFAPTAPTAGWGAPRSIASATSASAIRTGARPPSGAALRRTHARSRARRAQHRRDGARGGRRRPGEHAAMGGLHADGDRSGGRLHHLVRRRLSQARRDRVLHANRSVPLARLHRGERAAGPPRAVAAPQSNPSCSPVRIAPGSTPASTSTPSTASGIIVGHSTKPCTATRGRGTRPRVR
jgi:hypothetical protein